MDYWMPEWLYRLLPYLYIMVGLSAVFNTDTKVALISGLMLSNIGFLLIGLRRYHFADAGQPAPRGRRR